MNVLPDVLFLQIGARLTSISGPHPWPPNVRSSGPASWTSPRAPVTKVQPILVVEVEVDSSYIYGQLRHLARVVRLRPDLEPADLHAPPDPSA